jgi:lactoylglutathione lyase
MIRRIEHTTITVRDLNRSVDFYTRVLGFVVDHEMDLPQSRLHIVFLRLGDTILELFGVPDIHGSVLSDDNTIVGFKHIALLVDDVDAETVRLERLGVIFRTRPVDVQNERVIFFHDPDGIDIELIQHLN